MILLLLTCPLKAVQDDEDTYPQSNASSCRCPPISRSGSLKALLEWVSSVLDHRGMPWDTIASTNLIEAPIKQRAHHGLYVYG